MTLPVPRSALEEAVLRRLRKDERVLTPHVARIVKRLAKSASGYIRQAKLGSRDKRILQILVDLGACRKADSPLGMAYHYIRWDGVDPGPGYVRVSADELRLGDECYDGPGVGAWVPLEAPERVDIAKTMSKLRARRKLA